MSHDVHTVPNWKSNIQAMKVSVFVLAFHYCDKIAEVSKLRGKLIVTHNFMFDLYASDEVRHHGYDIQMR